jgi:8-amino-7-oxononanoate synthase
MGSIITSILSQKIKEREEEGNFRKLSITNHLIDFTSNDYLGISKSGIISELLKNLSEDFTFPSGSTGSRLLSGNSAMAEKLESYLSEFWGQEVLLFNSGYDANLGLWSSVPQKSDTLILDELIHACTIDGAKLSGAKRERFLHNDLQSLEEKLKTAAGNIFVGVESIYSMDGDQAPLIEMISLCEKYGAQLIVDEAHSTAIYGKEGRGMVSHLNLEDRVFARIFTFGKALGVHGAVVVGNSPLKDYLINFARTFIYTTALPLHSLHSILYAWEYVRKTEALREELFQKINHFQNLVKSQSLPLVLQNGAIQVIPVMGNQEVKKMAQNFVERGMDIRPILYPSVARGQERIRICLHHFNKHEEIRDLVDSIMELIPQISL